MESVKGDPFVSARIAVCLLSCIPVAIGAQSVPDRGALTAWSDSLQQVTSATIVDRFSRPVGIGSNTDGLGRALFLLRRGEVRKNRDDIEKALTLANGTARRHRDWPWCPLVLARGLSALELGGWTPLKLSDGMKVGESYPSAVWRNVRAAIDLDPDFLDARQWATSQFVTGGDRLLVEDQLAVLQREVHRSAPDPDALLVWGRHLRALRQYDSALAIFNLAVTLGGDRSRLALERARTLRALHDTAEATAAYWEGLAHVTADGREMYRFDLAWIIDADSMQTFDGTPDAELQSWMRAFWAERDAVAANGSGERLTEHLRRWALVYARYRVRSPWRRTMYDRIDMFFDNDNCLHMDVGLYQLMWSMPPYHTGDLRFKEWLLDQRGLLYLRHGEPLQRIAGHGPQFGPEDFVNGAAANRPDTTAVWSPWAKGQEVRTFFGGAELQNLVPYQMSTHFTESWLYLIEGQFRLVHFRDSYAIGMYDATTMSSFLPYSPSTWLARSGTLPEYHAAGERIVSELRFRPTPLNPPSCWKEVATANNRSRSDATAATRNDTDSPPLVHPWQSVIQILSLGADHDSSGKALITFALGGTSLHAITMADGRALYPIHFRVVAWNRTTGETVALDTTRRFVRGEPLTSPERLVATLEMPLHGGRWELGVRARQESDSSGSYAANRDLQIGSGVTLHLSDIVTGISGLPPWRATDGADFPISTSGDLPNGASAELYFEVHGVPTNESFRTTIAVRPVELKRGQPIRITSTGRSSGAVTYIRRSLDLVHLLPGEYEVDVTVEAGAQSTTRTRKLLILPANR